MKTIGITFGDPAGIGPEVITKSILKFISLRGTKLVIIGDLGLFRRCHGKIPDNTTFIHVDCVDTRRFSFGKPTKQTALASLAYIHEAFALLKRKEIDGLVTGPVSKEGICSLGKKFHGHTEYIADYFKIKNFDMMFVSKMLKTVVATRHIPLNRVSASLSKEKVLETISLTNQNLKKYFKIRNPKIGICGLNPHAGEKGTIGREEIRFIIPAIEQAKRKGIKALGPFSADTLFYKDHAKHFDCIIAMYHDQGIIPVKTLAFKEVVNVTIGLPFVRTSPAHGTAFDIAGKNKADPSSMIEAIALAAKLC